MASIASVIRLQDNFSATMNRIVGAVESGLSSVERMDRTLRGGVSTEVFETVRADAERTAAVLSACERSWQSFETPVFTTTGIERFESELTEAGRLMEQLTKAQYSVTRRANEAEVLSPQAAYDVENVENRLFALREMVANIGDTPLDMDIDEASARLERLRAQLEALSYPQQTLSEALAGGDESEINAAYLRMEESINNAVRSVRDGFRAAPVEIPVTWNTDGLEVFTGTGLERFEQEAAGANTMMDSLLNTQQQLAAQAANTELFPPGMTTDMTALQQRLTAIQGRIQAISNNPLNLGSDEASAELERLRAQLYSAEQAQEALNRAAENLDVAGANTAYLRLSRTVSDTERYLRDNTDEQGRFNARIEQGTRSSNKLLGSIKRVVAAYASIRTVETVVEQSDKMAQTTARLNLIVDDGGSVDELQQKIFASAQRARADYATTADVVAKLGQRAGDAFSGNDEIIAFAEALNKQFVIAGASQQEIASASLQLTQALGSGVLRGEELNAVFEAAPNIIQTVADYMGVPIGSIRDMAAEGQITAATVKNAMLAATDEINAKFESMPMTWGQAVTMFKNDALSAFQPVLDKINDIVNGDRFESFSRGMTAALGAVAKAAGAAMDLVVNVGAFMADNWSVVGPIIEGVAVTIGLAAIAQGVYNTVMGITTGIKTLATIASVAHGAAITQEMLATTGMTGAQLALNAAMLANPVTWIIIGFIALIAIIYAAVAAYNKFANKSVSATGVVLGALNVLKAFFMNKFVVPVQNKIAEFVNFFGNAFNDPVAAVKVLFYDMCLDVIGYIRNMAAAIEGIINKIPGVKVNITGGLDNLYNAVETAQQKVKDESGWVEYMSKWSYEDYGEAYEKGYAKGEELSQKLAGLTGSLNGAGLGGGLGGLEDYLGNIDDNTAAMAEESKVSGEELKLLREIAERQAINQFTTAEIKVDFTSNAQISSDMDIDGVVNRFEERLSEAVMTAAEGAHI